MGRMIYSFAFGILWVAWIVSWSIGALWASKPAKRPPEAEERFYWALTVVGSVLLVTNNSTWRFVMVRSSPDWVEWTLVAIAAAGLAFTWWARIHLGTLWSARVTRKSDHHIIDTGPYSIVRHPIYTGILIAVFATALWRPGVLGIVGAAVLVWSFVVKARLEERFLMQELGTEAYEGYRSRVPMLVPFWPKRG
jgi:protein-S-isoprenylcysteine O-methyltransferase Ste14